jgi:hypothetical protein
VDLLTAFYYHATGDHRRALDVLERVDWTSAMDPGWCLGLAYQQLDLMRGKVLLGEWRVVGREKGLMVR